MPDWLKLYHRSPYPLRVLAASARGYYLRWWRYGPEQEQWVEEALHRETWSGERWRQWREERLAYVLDRAATRVPYYRQQWQERRRKGDQAAWDMLENWPVLNKEALRETPHAFVAEDCDARTMFPERTSGTSGKPLQLWWSRDTVRRWYALHEARTRRWYDVDYKDRWAMLGGQLVTPFDQTCPPFWVWNAGLRQLYLSAFHLAPAYAAAYLEAMRRHRVVYLFGYASAMYALAQLILEKDWERPVLGVAVSNAEPFYLHQRQAIEQAFQCPTRDTYGMAEIVAGASECEAGTLHLWPEVGNVEVLHDSADDALSPGQTGRLVCTGLLNADMPLIRYEIGDLGSLAPAGRRCPCGRTLPILQSVEGRLDDVIRTRDGRRVGRLDPVFKADIPLREAQIIQERLDLVRVRIVPAKGYQARHGDAIIKGLRDRIGDMDIVLEQVDHIPRTASGKLRGVISRVVGEHETVIENRSSS